MSKSDSEKPRTTAEVVPLPRPRRCPICDRESTREAYPFCSKRCADIDLNRWLKGGYAIPAVEADDDLSEEDEEGRPSGPGKAGQPEDGSI